MLSSGKLFNELKSGKVYPVYLLLGEDRAGKDDFLHVLKNLISGQKNGDNAFDTTVFYGDEADPAKIVENLSTYSFFSDKKLTVVHAFDEMRNTGPLLDYLSSPNDNSVLVLLSDKNSLIKSIIDCVRQRGRVSIFWPMFRNKSEKWLCEKLNGMGITAEREAVKYVIDLSGTDKTGLNTQILNIYDYLGEGETLTLEKAEKIVARLYDYTVFDLANGLFIKPPKELLTIFRYLVINGEELVKILFFCSREVHKLFVAYSLKRKGYDFSGIIQKLNLRKMEADRVNNIINRTTLSTYRLLYSELASLDYIIKTNPREMAKVSFEKLLSELGSP